MLFVPLYIVFFLSSFDLFEPHTMSSDGFLVELFLSWGGGGGGSEVGQKG